MANILIIYSTTDGRRREICRRLSPVIEQILNSKPNAFFSVNVVARKPETNPYLKKFLKQISWQTKEPAVFAGKIEYQRYHFLDRQMIRLIMWMTKGPTDPETVVEFTDWKQVEAFGQHISTI